MMYVGLTHSKVKFQPSHCSDLPTYVHLLTKCRLIRQSIRTQVCHKSFCKKSLSSSFWTAMACLALFNLRHDSFFFVCSECVKQKLSTQDDVVFYSKSKQSYLGTELTK